MRWIWLCFFVLLAGSCFDPPRYREGIACSGAMTCPPGQSCDPATLMCRSAVPAPEDAAIPPPLDAIPVVTLDAMQDAVSASPADAASPADGGTGPCAAEPCGEHATCSDESGGYACVCDDGYVGAENNCRLPQSCLELLESQPLSPSGVYTLELNAETPPFETQCDMNTDGGGWTLVQRTIWDFTASSILYTDYETFRNQLLGSAAANTAFRVPGAHWPTLQQQREHLMRKVPRRVSDGGNCQALYYKATDGIWSMPAAGGATLTGAIDPNALFNTATAFSTLDQGPSAALCVNQNAAIPWLYASCCNTCPTYHGTYWLDGAHPMSSRMAVPDLLGATMFTNCAPDQPRRSDNNSSYYGINVMEYYVR